MSDLFNKNIKWIKGNSEKYKIKKGISAFSLIYTIIKSENGAETLVASIGNEEISIHSRINPVKSAEKIAKSTNLSQDHSLIIIGLGLGYEISSFCELYPDKQIYVIEPDISVFYLMLKVIDISKLSIAKFIIGYQDTEILQFIDFNKDKFDIITLKSEERLYGNLYERIKKSLRKDDFYKLSQDWKYKKFQHSQTRIIFIDSSYVLTKECLSAIQKSGNLVHYVHIDPDTYDYEQFFKKMLTDINQFKPDFILTINHLGFDKDGRLTKLFEEMELPFASWFVDSPSVILSTFDNNVSDFCNIFLWDDTYLSQVMEMGYKNCYYMPLATDPKIFYPLNTKKRYNVSFVGSSMVNAIHKNMQSWAFKTELIKIFDEVVRFFLEKKLQGLSKPYFLYEVIRYFGQDLVFDDQNQMEDFKSAVLWKATQIYRNMGIDKLSSFMPTIAGDPNWKYLLPYEFELLSERWYYDTLNQYYNESRINFNMTSLQMTNAVNQRLFDVSATRSFIITDYRTQIDELFNGKENIIYFNHIDEIPELIRYYLDNPNHSDKIASNAYNCVLQNHTYIHRIKKIIEYMKQNYQKEL